MNMRLFTLTGIVMLAALARLIPHPPNVTPIAAMALFGGAYFSGRKAAYAVPLAAMLLSDIILGFLVYGNALWASQPVVYACIIVMVAMGRLVRPRCSPLSVALVTMASSVMFYVVTNFAVWAFGSFYPRTWDGLTTCYIAAIPFFRNTVMGDFAFTALLFGGFALLQYELPVLREDRRFATS
jgi:hypothetical protein